MKRLKKSSVLGRPRGEREFIRKGWAPPKKWKELGRVAKSWKELALKCQADLTEAAAWREAVIATMHRFLRTAADDVPGQVSARASFVGFIGMHPDELRGTVDFAASLNIGEDGEPLDFRKVLRGEQTLPEILTPQFDESNIRGRELVIDDLQDEEKR